MTSIVYDAYDTYLRDKREVRDQEYKNREGYREPTPEQKGNLWPTDLGKCHRAAMQRATGVKQTYNFSTRGLDYMNTGVYTEDETLEALRHVYGDRLTDQVILKWSMWSGKADFGIDIGSDKPILIEHKTTSERHFAADATTELPKHEHIGQAVSYMYLYEKLHGITPEVRLFYKGWGCFAEFILTRDEGTVQIKGYVNGVFSLKKYDYDVYGEMEELMAWYDADELPPKLEKKYKGCTFMGRPSCAFYTTCWGEY